MPAGPYSYRQLEQLWTSAGGSRVLAPVMAAIAMAESGGNPQATNPFDNNGTQTSWGLWQISNGTHNAPVPGILDPLTNARQAVAKYRTEGLGAWGTYTSGAYQNFMQGGSAAIAQGVTGGQGFVDEARKFLGTPYVWGGESPKGFDCSGLVKYALEKIGVKNVPRTSEEQWQWVKHITKKDLQPGDLVFYAGSDGTNAAPGHVVIYAGDGQIIQAPHTGENVDQIPMPDGAAGYGRIPGIGGANFTGSTDTGQQAVLTSASLPGWAQGIGDVFLGPLAPIFQIFQGPLNAVQAIANGLFVVEQHIAWFFIPGHWVRIFAGIAGGGFVVMGVVTMSRTGRGYTVQVPSLGEAPAPGGQLAPAVGIAEVTIGSILLFVAFHNLPTEVTNFPTLISHLQGQIQRQGAQA